MLGPWFQDEMTLHLDTSGMEVLFDFLIHPWKLISQRGHSHPEKWWATVPAIRRSGLGETITFQGRLLLNFGRVGKHSFFLGDGWWMGCPGT